MGILDDLEKGIERAVNSVFARTFRSGLQPVEIIAALKREINSKASVVSRDRTLAPNRFVVELAAPDFERITSLGTMLESEIRAELSNYAKEHSYRLMGPITINLREAGNLREGMIQVSSELTGRDIVWVPVLISNGRRYRLQPGSNIIGRGSEADITIDDSGASRKHLEITWKAPKIQARDLGSTNGTKLNGVKFNTASLDEDSVLQIGRTRFAITLEPEASQHSQYERSQPHE